MLIIVAALLLTNYPAARAAVKLPKLSSADDLVDWVVKYGGQVKVEHLLHMIHFCMSAKCLKLLLM